MDTTNINVRVEKRLKYEAEELFKDLGLSMSTAITMFLRSAVSHQGIPFEVKRVTPNDVTKLALAEYEDMKTTPERYKRYNTFAELLDEVNDES